MEHISEEKSRDEATPKANPIKREDTPFPVKDKEQDTESKKCSGSKSLCCCRKKDKEATFKSELKNLDHLLMDIFMHIDYKGENFIDKKKLMQVLLDSKDLSIE